MKGVGTELMYHKLLNNKLWCLLERLQGFVIRVNFDKSIENIGDLSMN